MSPGEDVRGSLGRFSARVIGWQDGRPEGELTTALFQKLRDDDFLPDPIAHEALLALAGRTVGPTSLLAEEASADEERRLFVEVERFAAEFFEIPVPLRLKRWWDLTQSCARHARLVERLRALSSGLKIDRQSVMDRSPTVKRLADDLLEIFPLRPGPRAAESRQRVLRFRSDTELTDADRSRALKALAKRHPDLAALVPEYPGRVTRVRRRSLVGRFRASVAKGLVRSGEQNGRAYWIIAVLLMSAVGRLGTTRFSTPSPPSNLQALAKRPTPITQPVRWETAAIARLIRDDLKGPIRVELTRIGKAIDETQLERVVAELPVEQLPQVGGMATIRLSGLWTEPIRNRFIARLKAALKTTNLGLGDPELDDLAPRCFPAPARPGPP